jgi:hypothetical protein
MTEITTIKLSSRETARLFGSALRLWLLRGFYVFERVVNTATLESLEKKAEKLSKRAAKLGLSEVLVLRSGKPFLEKILPVREWETVRWERRFPITVLAPKVDFVVRDGFTLAAIVSPVIEKTEVSGAGVERLVTRLDGGKGLDLSSYRSGSLSCSHCGTRRKRHTYLIVREDETGEVLTLGTKCATEYVAGGATSVKSLEWMWREYTRAGGGWVDEFIEDPKPQGFHLDTILLYSAFYTHDAPYVRAGEDGSTKEAVLDLLYPLGTYASDKEKQARIKELRKLDALREKLTPVVESTKAWVAGLTPSSDYTSNLLAVFRAAESEGGLVTPKRVGIAVSAVPVAQRAVAKEAARKVEAESKPESKWVGEVGVRSKKLGLATVSRVQWGEGYYGPYCLFKFTLDTGESLVWFASSNSKDLQVGDRVEIKGATVKDHKTFKGVKETQVSRVTLKKVEAPAEGKVEALAGAPI